MPNLSDMFGNTALLIRDKNFSFSRKFCRNGIGSYIDYWARNVQMLQKNEDFQDFQLVFWWLSRFERDCMQIDLESFVLRKVIIVSNSMKDQYVTIQFWQSLQTFRRYIEEIFCRENKKNFELI